MSNRMKLKIKGWEKFAVNPETNKDDTLDEQIYELVKAHVASNANTGDNLKRVMEALVFHGVQCSLHLFKERKDAGEYVTAIVAAALESIEGPKK